MNQISFPSATGLCTVRTRCHAPQCGEPRAVVQLMHGMAEHIDRYDDFAGFLAQNGILVIGADMAGHGGSISQTGIKGYFGEKNGWNNLVEDAFTLHNAIKTAYPSIPHFLFGHSMGSFLARAYAARHGQDMAGFIFCGTAGKNPALPIAKLIAKAEIKLKGGAVPSKLLNSLAFGAYNKAFAPNRTGFDWLSANTANVDKYIADDNCGFIFTAAAFKDLFEGLCEVNGKNWPQSVPHKPIFIIAGDKDPVGDMGKGPAQVAAALTETGHDVVLKLYGGLRHEILNEDDKAIVYADILSFLNMHIG